MTRALLFLGVIALVGCKDDPPKPGASTAPSTAVALDDFDEPETVDDTIPEPIGSADDSAADDEPEEDPNDACAPVDPKLKPLQLLQFRWASGVKGKEPKDKLFVARPGQRVYAHLRVRNRSGRKRCLKLTFRVGNKKRTQVTVKIGKSWNWRTWAYNTVKPSDRQPLRLTILDDQGNTFLDERLAVVPE